MAGRSPSLPSRSALQASQKRCGEESALPGRGRNGRSFCGAWAMGSAFPMPQMFISAIHLDIFVKIWYICSMKQVISAKLKLHPTHSQFAALRQTQLAYRDALNYVSRYSFAHG